MTYEHAVEVFRRGHLREFVESARANDWREFELNVRVLTIYAVALAGDTALAASMLENEASRKKHEPLGFHLEATRGLIAWRSGDPDSAWKHLNLALNAAQDAKSLEWIAWAHLHLLRFAVDARPVD